MIKFKEQDGVIFKMLDKPVPLAPDSKLPCLVRLIQDDSPLIAQEIKERASSEGKLAIACCRFVTEDALHAYGSEGFCLVGIRQLEVIGCPVAETDIKING